MNDLLFIALLIALLYYFFIYLPQQKKSNPDPDTKSNQTNPDPKKTNSTETIYEFPSAKEVPNETYEPGIINCPSPLKAPSAITEQEKKELENTLDFLIQGMDELSRDLDKY